MSIIFGINELILETTGNQMTVQFRTSSVPAVPGENSTTFIQCGMIKIAPKPYFVYISDILADISFICPFLNCLE